MKRVLAFFQMLMMLILSLTNFNFLTFTYRYDTDFTVPVSEASGETLSVNGKNRAFSVSGGSFVNGAFAFSDKIKLKFDGCKTGLFNCFGLRYASDAYLKGTITYMNASGEASEEFFLEPSGDGEFFSFIDGCLSRKKAHTLLSLEFECLNGGSASLSPRGFAVFMREVPERVVYLANSSVKIGADLEWGGALSYLEDLDSAVQAVKATDGKIHVDSNAAQRYGVPALNDSVNLINCHDTGRLVQQSYYGSSGDGDEYEPGTYMGNRWVYNPVQGGNQFNGKSKIVDLRIDDASIYVKCRPMDWAKSDECITPSYMEARYSLDGRSVRVSCRFVDFSGYNERRAEQELPAFYTLAPFDTFVYYSGSAPWTGDETLTKRSDLYFWPDMGYPHFDTTENWSAFIGEFDDSFGVGLWVPGQTSVLAGICQPGETKSTDPATDTPTSYIGVTETHTFRSFSPFEYSYCLTTGSVGEMRAEFDRVRTDK